MGYTKYNMVGKNCLLWYTIFQIWACRYNLKRRSGREVDCICLENRSLFTRTVSSNLTSSALSYTVPYNTIMQEQLLQWSGVPYIAKQKSVDWFWILGLVVLLATGFAIYVQNYTFAAVIFVGGIAIGLFANENTSEKKYSLRKDGIEIDETRIAYSEIASFSVFAEGLASRRQLLLTLKKTFFVHVSIPLPEEIDHEEVRIILRKFVLEKKRLPDLSDAVMHWFRF
jgi:hypothetical protein